jgi:N-acetylglutamate synthase-like GNAT family acetyltransferase
VTGALGIRQATAADLPIVQEVISAAYEKYLTRMDRPPAPMLRDYAPVIEASALWVAGDPVAGVIALILTGDTLLIENLAVRPAAQGTGVGRALMDFAELRATQLKVTRLALYTHVVMAENQAIYQHLGYREVERKTVDGYHRVFMEKTLGS